MGWDESARKGAHTGSSSAPCIPVMPYIHARYSTHTVLPFWNLILISHMHWRDGKYYQINPLIHKSMTHIIYIHIYIWYSCIIDTCEYLVYDSIWSVCTGEAQSSRAIQQQTELGMVIGSRAHMQQAAVNKRAWHRYTVLHYCHLAYNCIPHVLCWPLVYDKPRR